MRICNTPSPRHEFSVYLLVVGLLATLEQVGSALGYNAWGVHIGDRIAGRVVVVNQPETQGSKESLGNTEELWSGHPLPPGSPPSHDSCEGSVCSFFMKEGGISLALI